MLEEPSDLQQLKAQVNSLVKLVQGLKTRLSRSEARIAQTRKIEIGAMIAGLVAVVGFAFYLGGLNKDVEFFTRTVKSNDISKPRNEAINQIEAAKDNAIAQLKAMECVPVGAIVAWPGPLPSKKSAWYKFWQPCGRDKKVEFNKKLWDVLRGKYGNPDAEVVKYINLPNLAGYFLRGLDKDGSVDPDGKDRTEGHAQKDAVGPHVHKVNVVNAHNHPSDRLDGGTNWERVMVPSRTTITTGPKREGDKQPPASETRAKNVAVHWIIRVQ